MASQQRKIKRAAEQNDTRLIITTSLGVQVECHPIIAEIEAQEENIRSQFEWPEVPEADISDTVPPDAGPDWPRTMLMTQAWVEGESATDEDKQAWFDYQAELARVDTEFNTKLNEARVRLFALKGVTVIDMPPEDEWVEDHEWLGMVVPDKPRERALHYFRTEVLGSPTDMVDITAGIYKAAGLNSEALERYQQSFRDQMGRAVGEALGSDQETTGEGEDTAA